MSLTSNLSLWKLSIYAAAISSAATIVGPIVSPIQPPAAFAQTTLCKAPTGAKKLPAGVPSAAVTAANKYVKSSNIGNINVAALKLSTVRNLNDTVKVGSKVTIYELGGVQTNGCQYEIDVNTTSGYPLDEIELQIPNYVKGVPLAARNLVAKKVPGFKATFAERSIRPKNATGFNSSVVYELEGKNSKGQVVEVDVNPNGTYIVVTTPTF